MTSLAGLYDWLVAGKAASREAARRGEEDFRVRVLPREDIHLYVKDIDNTKVVRVVDKKDWLASVGMAAGVLMASLLLIAVLLPGGYSLLASRRMERLKTEREYLVNTLREIRVREAALMSPQQMERWAGERFVEPSASAVVFAPPARGTVASLGQR